MKFILPGVGYYLLLLLCIGIITYLWLNLRKKLFLMRLLSLLLLFVLLLQPTYKVHKVKSKPCIGILVDTSQSMNFASRLFKVKRLLMKYYKEMDRLFEAHMFHFSSDISSVEKINDLAAKGTSTDIVNALYGVKQSLGDNLDAILLFSDGIHNATSEITSVASVLDIPVYPVTFIQERGFVDLALTDVHGSDFCFKNIPYDITGIFSVAGVSGKEVFIELRKDKNIISSKKVYVQEGFQEVNFSFIPSELGKQVYTLEILPYPGEITLANNSITFEVNVLREKLRILYICGQPSPEYFFLRHFLKSNPGIDLVSFVILRNPENISFVPDYELSLIPFPTQEIFVHKLFEFDILILENFSYARFAIPLGYLENISRFVKEKGGGLLMIAGENAFGKGGYRNTPIEELLPVVLEPAEENIERGFFTPKVILPEHPLCQISDRGDIKKVLSELPPLEGCQRLRPKSNTSVIAVHPFLKTEAGNLVVLSAGECGKGRTVALGTNTTWRWALGMAKKGSSTEYYNRFWRNIINWLSGITETKQFSISFDRNKFYTNEPIQIKLIILDKALEKLSPQLKVIDAFRKLTHLSLRKSSYGWLTNYILDFPGEYTFSAELQDSSGKVLYRDSRKINALLRKAAETTNLCIDFNLLNNLTQNTNAAMFDIDTFSIASFRHLVKMRSTGEVVREIPLWSGLIFWLILVLLLLTEWYIRRKRGLL